MKKNYKLIIFALTVIGSCEPVLAEDRPTNSVELVSKLKIDDDDQTLMRCNAAIKLDNAITEQTRLELRIKYLILAQRYLKNRSIPSGTVYSNLAPPDGGPSGSDPKSVKDPMLRAQYEKSIAENEALSKARGKYNLLIRNRYDITKDLAAMIVGKTASSEDIATILYQNTTTPEEAKELMSFIDQAAVAANQSPSPWPDAQ